MTETQNTSVSLTEAVAQRKGVATIISAADTAAALRRIAREEIELPDNDKFRLLRPQPIPSQSTIVLRP